MLILALILCELRTFVVQNQSSNDLSLEEVAQIGGGYKEEKEAEK